MNPEGLLNGHATISSGVELSKDVLESELEVEKSEILAIHKSLRKRAKRAVRRGTEKEQFLDSLFAVLKKNSPLIRIHQKGILRADVLSLALNENGMPMISADHGELMMDYELAAVDEKVEDALRREREDSPEWIKKEMDETESRIRNAKDKLDEANRSREEKRKEKDEADVKKPDNGLVIGVSLLFLGLSIAEILSFYLGLAENIFGVSARFGALFEGANALKAWGALTVSIGLFVVATMLGERLLKMMEEGKSGDAKNLLKDVWNVFALVSLLMLGLFASLIRKVVSAAEAYQRMTTKGDTPISGNSDWVSTVLLIIVTIAIPIAAAALLRVIRNLFGLISEAKEKEKAFIQASQKCQYFEIEIKKEEEKKQKLEEKKTEAKRRQETVLKKRYEMVIRSSKAWKDFLNHIESVLKEGAQEFDMAKYKWDRWRESFIGRLVIRLIGVIL